MLKHLKIALGAVCLFGAGPALSCSTCVTEVTLVPEHVGCAKARIKEFIAQSVIKDPFLFNYVTCNTVGPMPDGFEPKGSIEIILPTTAPPVRSKPVSLPEGYKIFGYFSSKQLVCLGKELDVITERPTEPVTFTFSEC